MTDERPWMIIEGSSLKTAEFYGPFSTQKVAMEFLAGFGADKPHMIKQFDGPIRPPRVIDNPKGKRRAS